MCVCHEQGRSGQTDSRPIADSDHTGSLQARRPQPKNIGPGKASKTSEFEPHFNMDYHKDHIESPMKSLCDKPTSTRKLTKNARKTLKFRVANNVPWSTFKRPSRNDLRSRFGSPLESSLESKCKAETFGGHSSTKAHRGSRQEIWIEGVKAS